MFPDLSKVNAALDTLATFQTEMRTYMERIAVAVERLVELEEAKNQPQGGYE